MIFLSHCLAGKVKLFAIVTSHNLFFDAIRIHLVDMQNCNTSYRVSIKRMYIYCDVPLKG
jgi:hypothetical protein